MPVTTEEHRKRLHTRQKVSLTNKMEVLQTTYQWDSASPRDSTLWLAAKRRLTVWFEAQLIPSHSRAADRRCVPVTFPSNGYGGLISQVWSWRLASVCRRGLGHVIKPFWLVLRHWNFMWLLQRHYLLSVLSEMSCFRLQCSEFSGRAV
jgi:hypothetical protein